MLWLLLWIVVGLLLASVGFAAGWKVAEQMPLERDMLAIANQAATEAEYRIAQYWATGCARMDTWGRTWNGTPFDVVVESGSCDGPATGDPYILGMYLEQDMYEISEDAVFAATGRMRAYWAEGCASMSTWGATWNGTPFYATVAVCM